MSCEKSMDTYYCDGSQHKGYGKLGVGIVSNSDEFYYDTEEFDHGSCIHEIEAIRKTIELAVRNNNGNIVIVNDDRHLVKKIQESKDNRKLSGKLLRKKKEFINLVGLVKEYNITVRIPDSKEDKAKIKRCHHLSRRYMI